MFNAWILQRDENNRKALWARAEAAGVSPGEIEAGDKAMMGVNIVMMAMPALEWAGGIGESESLVASGGPTARAGGPPGSSSVYRGKVGNLFVKAFAEKQGYTYVGSQITVDVQGGKTVILDDLFTDPNRNLVSFDAKNGPGARLTPNQAVEYPRINQGTPVTPRGPNAQSANLAGQPITLKVEPWRLNVTTIPANTNW